MWKLRAVNDELVRLYEVDGLSMLQLARRFGVTRQGIHDRLKRQGICIRPQGRPRPRIDELALRSLYLDQKLSGREIAIRFNVKQSAVYYWLKAFNIKSRGPGCYRKYPELANLQVGESMTVPRPKKQGRFQHYFYPMAQKHGIKVSVKTLNGDTVRLTRVE